MALTPPIRIVATHAACVSLSGRAPVGVGSATTASIGVGRGRRMSAMLDLLISGGLVVDGTGSPGFHAAVGVEGDTVAVLRGDVSRVEAARTIDASGLVVCPGFIDLHSHAGLTMLGEPHHDPKVRQGVTTELIGIDGISHSPFRSREELERAIWLDSGLNGYPPAADWLTTPGALPRYDGTRRDQRRDHPGQQPASRLGRWLERPARHARRDRGHVGRPPRVDGRGGVGPVIGPRLPAGLLCLDRRADCARRTGGAPRWLLSHPHSLAADGVRPPRALPGGRGHRPARRLSGAPDALPPAGAGCRQPPRLHRPGRGRARRRARRHVRLLLLSVLRHDAGDPAAAVGTGRGSGGADGASRAIRPRGRG